MTKNNPEKRLQFSMWDDFQFECAPKEYDLLNLEKIDFDIEKENILYEPIKRFLEEDKEFILDEIKEELEERINKIQETEQER